MHLLRPAIALAAAALLAPLAHADADWQKTYPISGRSSLTTTTGDASSLVRSCGDCREIRVRIEWHDRRAADYTISEFQTGDHVNFELHEKRGLGFHITVGNRHEPQVTIDTPAATDLEARTADGGLKVSGLNGNLQLHTSDGSMDVWDVNGALHLLSSDGSIHVHGASGTLESRSSDGQVKIEGRFTAVQVHTSDGGLELTLANGSQLATASRIETSDGSVAIHLPHSLAADLEIRTGDGHLDCKLPLVMEGYDSKSDSGHSLRGKLNGGGVPLTIRTRDGNATIDAL
ncbi:DUF4097 domain-containing protein [Acidobacteria bacterium AB60]|nr:DUF4097 domain-containing protein [Acidobacteria bacterium AB60]